MKCMGSYKKHGSPEKQKLKMIEDIQGLFKAREYITIEPACREILNFISWKYTELGTAKNLDVKYWSKEALKTYEKTHNGTKGLIHEHVIPRTVFVDAIIEKLNNERINGLTSEEINIIDNNLICCIITEFEHERLSRSDMGESEKNNGFFKIKNKWARYENTGIEVCEVKRNSKELSVVREVSL